MGNFFAACVSPLLVVLAKQFHVSTTDTSHLAIYAVLTIGLSNLLAIPISQYIGKRYTILLSMILFIGVNIWGAYCTTYNELLASRIVGGLAAGIVEALGPLIIAECFTEAYLASAMVVYTLSLGAGASLGPLVAGLVHNGTHTWPWTFGISAFITAVNLLSSILMLPETTGLENFYEVAPPTNATVTADAEKAVTDEIEQARDAVSSAESESLYDQWIHRSFFWTLPDIKPEANFLVLFFQPLWLLCSPAVVFTSVIFGILIAFTVIISIVYGTVLGQPPILWTPLKIGLLNLSPLIGLIVGMPTGGYLADVLYRRSARNHEGIGLRESRIFAALPGAIISPLGLIVIGVCLQKHLSWVGLAFGWMMSNIGLTAVASVLLTYCVDCYSWKSAHIGVVVNVIKNMVSFGVSYAAVPWYLDLGPQKQFGTMAGILLFFLLLIIPLRIYSTKLRELSLKYIA
ncbi:major facilitator superfamily domain-containing protein [Bisporella sp. PMI_857]|nr:major facilitator superfamily domain-containing protein [Bisporella sp. PMI_857]